MPTNLILDRSLSSLENALRTISGASVSSRPAPRPPSLTEMRTEVASHKASALWADNADGVQTQPPARGGTDHEPKPPMLSDGERRLSGALMRVNHVGEVCAQALYQAQALTARSPQLRDQMLSAAREETDHLAWTQARLRDLGDRPSLLNPLWYAGSFAIGLVAGRLGDAASLGFVVETERQVEAHLAGHLERLPSADLASRAIVEQMKADEARHADEAVAAGAAPMPEPVKWLMRGAAMVMTTMAHRV